VFSPHSRKFPLIIIFLLIAAFAASHSYAQVAAKGTTDTTRYPIKDRIGDPFTYNSANPFNGSDTAYVKRDIQYDPKTKQYYIIEK
jgi:hypothetical protein